jgi:TonB-dependent starch-binding outer membrane protein SusC
MLQPKFTHNFITNLVLCLVFLLGHSVQAQDGFFKVVGEILDKSGQSVPFANVVLKGSIVGVNADRDGRFILNVADKNSTIVISSIGYQTQEVPLEGKNSVNVILEEELSQLGEAVVVGYGSQKKSVVTGAISSIKNKDFRDQPVANIASSMQSKVSGVLVSTPSGTPGAGLLVSIRGTSNPLYVIDGIPIVSESNTALSTSYDLSGNELGQSQNISSIADLNPNDVESIEILKDASAASIYGVRAANGVVLITTKRGSSEKTEFGVSHYTGLQKAYRTPQFLSSSELYNLVEDARQQDLAKYKANDTIFGKDFDPEYLTNPLPAHWKGTTNTNWLDEIFRTAPINNTEVYARGGNTKTRFHISGNAFDQKGIMLNSGYKRYAGRINLDHRVNEKFSIGNTLNLTRSENQRVFNDDTYSGILTNAQGADPLMAPYLNDGSYTSIDNTRYNIVGKDSLQIIDNHTNWLSDNILKSSNEISAHTQSSRILGSVFGEYRLGSKLKFKSSWSLDYTNLNDRQHWSPNTTDGGTVGGRSIFATFNNTTWLGENFLTYKTAILEDHHLDLTAGMSLQKSQSLRSNIIGEGFPNGAGLQLIGNAATIVNAKVTSTQWALMSYVARANYDYKDKIILAASVRVDGSSRFNADNRYATFPSLSVGYRFVKTSDDPNVLQKLSDLKFRASYGLTGDQEIGDFRNRELWGSANYLGKSGLRQQNIADPTLGWQQNTMLNAGFDFEFLKGKYGGSIEAFKANKKKLLSEVIVPGTTGFPTIARNVGELQNTGVEFQLFGTLINTGKLRFTVNANATYLKNKIVSLAKDGELLYAYNDIAATHVLKVGQPLGTFWGIKSLGVNKETGDMEYEDLNGDGTIDSQDGQIIGHAYPKVFGGLNFVINYKKLDITVANSFSLGNQVYNYNRYFMGNMGWANDGWNEETKQLDQIYINTTKFWADKRWQKPGDVTDVPRASLVNQTYIETNSAFIEDASFWKIRTINIGYTVRPERKRVFDQARIYAQVQNPFVFTKYSWFDPEVSSTGGGQDKTAGIDNATYPQARTTTIGINVTF